MEAVHLGFPPETVALFVGVVAFSIYADLFMHRRSEDVSIRDAAIWSLFWVGLSLAFAGYLNFHHGSAAASMFLSGYVLEKSLSVDNLMVFIVIFKFFGIEGALRHRILYFGILGAIVFRLIFVAVGGSLMVLFGKWVDLAFAALILWSAVQMLRGGGDDEEEDFNDMLPVRVAKKFFPVLPMLVGHRFFVPKDEALKLAGESGLELSFAKAARFMTPAFICLLVIEASDVMFSFDSVPAVIAITREPLLVYAAMIFAMLGLRTLYFILAALTKYLVHLEKAVVLLLFFISAKLILHATYEFKLHSYDLSPNASLAVIGALLGLGVIASFVFPGEPEPD